MLDILDVNDTGNIDQQSIGADPANNQIVSPTKIKVIGCGGGGGNAVNNMIASEIQGVQFIALNTDLQQLTVSKADYKIQIGKKLTNGLGAGSHPEVGEAAAKEDEETIKNLLAGTDMVFITAGMGGGTGTGSAPVVAKIAKDLGILTVAVVTTPFEFEGETRMELARDGIKKLRDEVDSLIIIPNQRVFETSEKKLSVIQAFRTVDDVLRQGVKGISEIITKTGLINRDFKDVQTVMKGQGDCLFGIGLGQGENRAIDAAANAINNKLLADTHIDGAKNILVKISGNDDLGMEECMEIVQNIKASADKRVRVLMGLYYEPELEDKISVTVVATGFNSEASSIPDEMSQMFTTKTETVKKSDPNVIDYGTFDDIISGKTTIAQSAVAEKAEISEAEIGGLFVTPESSTSNVNNGSLSSAMKIRSMTIEPPEDFHDDGDINKPACWRKFPGGINVTKQ